MTPCTVKPIGIERMLGSGPQPEIVINSFRRRSVWLRKCADPVIKIGPNIHFPQSANFAWFYKAHHILKNFIVALLLPHLNHTIETISSLHHDIAFANRICHWFFYVNIFPGLAGFHHNQAVPVIRCSDNYRIDVVSLQHFTVIFVQFRRLSVVFFYGFGTLFQDVFVYITQGHTVYHSCVEMMFQYSKPHVAATN